MPPAGSRMPCAAASARVPRCGRTIVCPQITRVPRPRSQRYMGARCRSRHPLPPAVTGPVRRAWAAAARQADAGETGPGRLAAHGQGALAPGSPRGPPPPHSPAGQAPALAPGPQTPVGEPGCKQRAGARPRRGRRRPARRTAAASHKQATKVTADATAVTSHLAARLTRAHLVLSRTWNAVAKKKLGIATVPTPLAIHHRVPERGGRFCCHRAAIMIKA